MCKCVCGTIRDVQAGNLVHGTTHGCGCTRRSGNIKHGLSKTPEHVAWKNMNGRCHNANRPDYIDYGGRGIVVCDRWRGEHGFENFLADVGHKPSPEHSLDRKENDGNYEPNNCHWATRQEQVLNRRKSRKNLTKQVRHFEQLSGMSIDDLIKSYEGKAEATTA